MHIADEFEEQRWECDRELAHLMVRGLALAHIDATLKGLASVRRFLGTDIAAALARRGVEAEAR